MKENQLPYYMVLVALFMLIVSPSLLSDGMFLDGVTYAAVSKNLANGLGSFWDLHYTNTLYPHFHEHPPLAFGIQGLLFHLLGDSILVERLYSIGTFFITGFIMVLIWKRIMDKEFHTLAWLPLLFWILIPLVNWAAANNILENTMMIFTSLAVLFFLNSLSANRLLYLSLAGLMLFFGFLTKGFVALFPLALPFWMIVIRSGTPFKRVALDSVVLLACTLFPFFVMFLIMPESKDSLLAYIDKQVVVSLQSVITVDSRFYILRKLFNELIPGLILLLLLIVSLRKKKLLRTRNPWTYVFLALGMSGVVPIMISLKQRGFYILATYPIFSIALATFALPFVKQLVDRIDIQSRGYTLFKYVGIFLLITGLFLNTIQFNRFGRDKETIEDVIVLMEIIPGGTTISVPPEIWGNWSLHAYFQRYAEISLDSKEPFEYGYFMAEKGYVSETLNQYRKHPVALHNYELYVNLSTGQ